APSPVAAAARSARPVAVAFLLRRASSPPVAVLQRPSSSRLAQPVAAAVAVRAVAIRLRLFSRAPRERGASWIRPPPVAAVHPPPSAADSSPPAVLAPPRPPRRPPVVDLVSVPPVAAVLHSVKLREVVQIRPSWIGRPSAVRPSSPLLSSGVVFTTCCCFFRPSPASVYISTSARPILDFTATCALLFV
ncbi:unnamed protein product, partial [Urochloa humidicola]